MNEKLHRIYEGIEEEFRRFPLVVFPAELDEKRGHESYWVVFEGDNEDAQSREIVWLVGGIKDVSEAEGPSASSCPLFFFELVPNATSPKWRERVKWFWKVQGQPESEQENAWAAYDAGIDAYRCLQSIDSNPHPHGCFNYMAWETGWTHAKGIG